MVNDKIKCMHTNRRQFLKTTGAGIAGFGILPALGFPAVERWDDSFRRVTPESQGVSSQSIRALSFFG
jgi:hypothetical protein